MLVRIEERCDMFLARRSTACRARLAAWDVLAKIQDLNAAERALRLDTFGGSHSKKPSAFFIEVRIVAMG